MVEPRVRARELEIGALCSTLVKVSLEWTSSIFAKPAEEVGAGVGQGSRAVSSLHALGAGLPTKGHRVALAWPTDCPIAEFFSPSLFFSPKSPSFH